MRRWKRWRWLIALGIVIILGIGFWSWRKAGMATPGRFAVVQRETLTVAIKETGTIEPMVKVAVKSKVAGRIMALKSSRGRLRS